MERERGLAQRYPHFRQTECSVASRIGWWKAVRKGAMPYPIEEAGALPYKGDTQDGPHPHHWCDEG